MTADLSRLAVPARWRNALAILGVCLPVPLSAMTGLSLPLPAVVERLAAGLVPWIETAGVQANEALARGAVGSIGIVLDEVDPSTDETQSAAAPRVVRVAARTKVARPDGGSVPALPSSDRAPAGEETSRAEEAPRGAEQSAASPAPGEEAPVPAPVASDPPPATDPPTDPAPPPPTNDPDPVAPVVGIVDDTVDTGNKVVDDVTETVEDVTGVPVPNVPPLPGLGG
jgi:hypothetical protein